MEWVISIDLPLTVPIEFLEELRDKGFDIEWLDPYHNDRVRSEDYIEVLDLKTKEKKILPLVGQRRCYESIHCTYRGENREIIDLDAIERASFECRCRLEGVSKKWNDAYRHQD